MNNSPILVVSGEPFSVFIEIFLKCLKKNKFKKKIILIVSKKIFMKQMKSLGFNFDINSIDINNINEQNLYKKKINIIDVNFVFKNSFERITNKSNKYINECFVVALKLLETKKFSGLINGPISKKNFLKGKFLGITEYLAEKTKKKNDVAMLIYNKKLSVSPITTHLPLKDVHKNLSKKKLLNIFF